MLVCTTALEGKSLIFLHELRCTLISELSRGYCCAIQSHWSRHACFSRRLSWNFCYSNYHCWVEKPSDNGVFTCTQLPLNLSWAFTIHKIQGKTLELLVIDLGEGEQCSGLTLVVLSRARMFIHFLLKSLTVERLRKVNNSSVLVDIKNTLSTLE